MASVGRSGVHEDGQQLVDAVVLLVVAVTVGHVFRHVQLARELQRVVKLDALFLQQKKKGW